MIQFKKLFTSRSRILLVLLLIVLVSAGSLFYLNFKQKSKADIDTLNKLTNFKKIEELDDSNIVRVKLPDELVNVINNQEKKPITRSKVDSIKDIIERESAKKIIEIKSKESKQLNLFIKQDEQKRDIDLLIQAEDQNGNILTPDLDKLRKKLNQSSFNNFFTSIAHAEDEFIIPDTNEIRFTIDDSFTENEKIQLQQTIDQYYPQIREVAGPPFFDIDVTLKKSTYNSYNASLNLIKLGSANNPEALVHEISHAWRDEMGLTSNRTDIGGINQLYEEGLSTVVGDILSSGKLTWSSHYDSANNPHNQMQFLKRDFLSYYALGGEFIAKILMDNPDFIKKFHQNYYNLFLSKTYLDEYQRIDIYKTAEVATKVSIDHGVEGKSAEDWLSTQYIAQRFSPPFTGEYNKINYYLSPLYATNGSFVAYQFWNQWDKPPMLDIMFQLEKKLDFIIKSPKGETIVSGSCVTNDVDMLGCDAFGSSSSYTVNIPDYSGMAEVTWSEEISGVHAEVLTYLHITETEPQNFEFVFSDGFPYSLRTPFVFSNQSINSGKLVINDRHNSSNKSEIKIEENGQLDKAPDFFDNVSAYDFSYKCPNYNNGLTEINLGYKNKVNSGFFNMYNLAFPTDPQPNITTLQDSALTYTITTNQSIDLKETIYSEANQQIKQILDNQIISGARQIDWDGTDDQGVEVQRGNYYLKVEGVNQFCQEVSSELNFTFDPNALQISNLTAIIGQANVDISYSLSEYALVTVKIKNSNDQVVRNLIINQAQNQGVNSLAWNGRNNSNQLVTAGSYKIEVTAVKNLPGAVPVTASTNITLTNQDIARFTTPPTAPTTIQAINYLAKGSYFNQVNHFLDNSPVMRAFTNDPQSYLTYKVNFGSTPKQWLLKVTGVNGTNSLPPNPAVPLIFDVAMDRDGTGANFTNLDQLWLKATNSQFVDNYINLGSNLTGVRQIRLTVQNDSYSPGNYDNNPAVRSLEFLERNLPANAVPSNSWINSLNYQAKGSHFSHRLAPLENYDAPAMIAYTSDAASFIDYKFNFGANPSLNWKLTAQAAQYGANPKPSSIIKLDLYLGSSTGSNFSYWRSLNYSANTGNYLYPSINLPAKLTGQKTIRLIFANDAYLPNTYDNNALLRNIKIESR